jgi:hypothetical protein
MTMITESPRAHLWLDVPDNCRFESSVVAEDEVRMVIGHPLKDGHTLEMGRDALRRLHAITGDTLEAMNNGSWMNTNTTQISEPTPAEVESSIRDRPSDPEAPLVG